MVPLIPAPGLTVQLVEERENPSAAYYLLPVLAAFGATVVRRSLAEVPPAGELAGTMVVLDRYLSGPWCRAIAAVRAKLAGLAYFMDDDLLDPSAAVGLPWRYRWKLYRLAGRYAGWLRRMGAAFWVSTPWLAAKYAASAPRLVPPAPLPERDATGAEGRGRCLFYHGTASHRAEIAWLRPLVAGLVADAADLEVELVGGRAVARRYAGLPRVTVVRPLSWPDYCRFGRWPGRRVGLAPQLPTAFNAARSHVKFFDITRSGAVGVYAAGSACAAVVTDGRDGLVAPMETAAWQTAVRRLLADEPRRLAMLAAARETCARLSLEARAAWGLDRVMG